MKTSFPPYAPLPLFHIGCSMCLFHFGYTFQMSNLSLLAHPPLGILALGLVRVLGGGPKASPGPNCASPGEGNLSPPRSTLPLPSSLYHHHHHHPSGLAPQETFDLCQALLSSSAHLP